MGPKSFVNGLLSCEVKKDFILSIVLEDDNGNEVESELDLREMLVFVPHESVLFIVFLFEFVYFRLTLFNI
jgi:hypothetical protein